MCGEVLDRWGDHALSCCCGGDRVLRHNAVRNVVYSAVAEFTSVSPELEKPALLLPPENTRSRRYPPRRPSFVSPVPPAASRRPADVWVPRGGSADAWDFSVSSLLRSSHLSSASPSVADVFHEVETRKRAFQDTASLVAERGATLCPLVLEACGGGWSQALRGVASESRTARGLATDLPRDTSLRIAQRISCTLHRGKRSCNPETFPRVCQRVIWFGGPASGW